MLDGDKVHGGMNHVKRDLCLTWWDTDCSLLGSPGGDQ